MGSDQRAVIDLIQETIVGTSTGYTRHTAHRVLDALRALPVEQRMNAMGMVSVTFQPTDEPYTYWREPLDG